MWIRVQRKVSLNWLRLRCLHCVALCESKQDSEISFLGLCLQFMDPTVL